MVRKKYINYLARSSFVNSVCPFVSQRLRFVSKRCDKREKPSSQFFVGQAEKRRSPALFRAGIQHPALRWQSLYIKALGKI